MKEAGVCQDLVAGLDRIIVDDMLILLVSIERDPSRTEVGIRLITYDELPSSHEDVFCSEMEGRSVLLEGHAAVDLHVLIDRRVL